MHGNKGGLLALGLAALLGAGCSGDDAGGSGPAGGITAGGDFNNAPTSGSSGGSGGGAGAGTDDGSGPGSESGSGSGSAPGTCADTTVRASQVTPTVILIVDQSSSMEESFEDDRSRWNVLRDFLLDAPNGLIADLQSQVRFGLALYSAESGGTNPDPIGECPMITTVAPALDNYDAIASVYRGADVIEDTPTGDSIDAIVEELMLDRDPDAQNDPIVFILATDGEPDRCEELDPQNGQQEAIAAVERAYQLGIRTFIISVGEGTVSAEHQQDVANAGLGRGPGDEDAEFWVAGDDQSLRAALTEIVGSQLGCEVQLNGSVEGDACLGRVVLNGRNLECDGGDGWVLSSPRTIRLQGQACDDLKNLDEVLLEVSFPCEVGVVF